MTPTRAKILVTIMASSRGDVVVVVMMIMTSSGGDVEVVVMMKVCALTILLDAFKHFHFR